MKQDSEAFKRTARKVLPPIFGVIFILSCLALPQYIRAKKSRDWPTTSGQIISSSLQVRYFKGMKGYYAEIRYRYRVGDTNYEGNQISFNRVHAAVAEAWQPVVDAYLVGRDVNVYYDPKNPSIAVLEPGLHGEIALLYKMTLLYMAGSGLAFLMAVSARRG
jgi:Protein of unknown function (DUF3592)